MPRSARSDWEGIDYSKLVLGESKKPVQDYVVFTFDDYQAGQSTGPYVRPPQHLAVVRETNWKIAKYYDPNRTKAPQWELYHPKKDPLETTNLAAPGYRRNRFEEQQYKRMRRKLAEVEATRLQPLPHDAFSLRSCRLGGEVVEVKVRVPGRGRLVQKVTTEVDGKTVELGTKSRHFDYANTASMSHDISRGLRKLSGGRPVRIKVTNTFLPNGGTAVIKVRSLKLKRRTAAAR